MRSARTRTVGSSSERLCLLRPPILFAWVGRLRLIPRLTVCGLHTPPQLRSPSQNPAGLVRLCPQHPAVPSKCSPIKSLPPGTRTHVSVPPPHVAFRILRPEAVNVFRLGSWAEMERVRETSRMEDQVWVWGRLRITGGPGLGAGQLLREHRGGGGGRRGWESMGSPVQHPTRHDTT